MRQEPDDGDKGAEQQRNKDETEPQRFIAETKTTAEKIIGGVMFCFHTNKYGSEWSRIEFLQDFFLGSNTKGVFTLAQDRSLP